MASFRVLILLITVSSCPSVRSEVDFIAERLPLQGNRPHPGSPWPMPKDWLRENTTLTFMPRSLTLISDLHGCDIIDQAMERFMHRLDLVQESQFSGWAAEEEEGEGEDVSDTGKHSDDTDKNDIPVVGILKEVKIYIENATCPGYPQYGVQENYTLEITSNVELHASNAWAGLLGLETLSQLMYMIGGKWYINQGTIDDSPRFKFRGLHLDTSRHYYPLDFLKTTLDIMLTNKFNVFHWHIVDAQSFPYQSIKYPNLTEKGAFSPRHIYTQEDIRELIDYARLRGIRVLPEFDTPGHAHSWGKAMPELLTPCYAGGHAERANYSNHAARENFDPSKNYTFEFLEDFFAEIVNVFPDEYLHLGMDEAHYMCWESSPEIADFMKSQGMRERDFPALEHYFSVRLLDIIQRTTDKKAMIWEDPINLGQSVPNNTLIHLWKDLWPGNFGPWQNYTEHALRAGYDVVFSSCWYISKISYGEDWKKYYDCDPYHMNATDEQKTHIMGGIAGTWSEFIDEINAIQVMWPRGSAIAERLWSPAHVNNTDDATFRLDQHRCRYVRQGIPAGPTLPGFCQDDYNTDNALIHHPIKRRQQHQQTTVTTQQAKSATKKAETSTAGKDNSAAVTSAPTSCIIALILLWSGFSVITL